MKSYFFEDTSIEKGKYDELKRGEVAKELAEQILILDNKKSFALGITGDWGSGKHLF